MKRQEFEAKVNELREAFRLPSVNELSVVVCVVDARGEWSSTFGNLENDGKRLVLELALLDAAIAERTS